MDNYYTGEDLDRFAEVGSCRPDLFKKFMEWYSAALEPGTVSRREKALIGIAIAHVIQCPYCIDAYTRTCLEEGLTMEHITEAVHVASAIRGGAALIHAIQSRNVVGKLSL